MRNNNEIQYVAWDGDNTLWDWVGYAVPAYEAMHEAIVRISGRSPDDTADAMKAFYTQVGTIEDERLVQGLHSLGLFDGVAGFDMDEAIISVQRAFHNVRNRELQVYPGIAEAMHEIHRRCIEQIIITDAPGGQASARLRRSGLSGYISRIYGMPTAPILDLPGGLKKHFEGEQNPPVHVLNEEKPNVELEAIFEKTREEIRKRVGIVGDNDAKDMELARRYGCVGAHAVYGNRNSAIGSRLARFAPPRVASRNMQIGEGNGPSGRIVVIEDPREIPSAFFGG